MGWEYSAPIHPAFGEGNHLMGARGGRAHRANGGSTPPSPLPPYPTLMDQIPEPLSTTTIVSLFDLVGALVLVLVVIGGCDKDQPTIKQGTCAKACRCDLEER